MSRFGRFHVAMMRAESELASARVENGQRGPAPLEPTHGFGVRLRIGSHESHIVLARASAAAAACDAFAAVSRATRGRVRKVRDGEDSLGPWSEYECPIGRGNQVGVARVWTTQVPLQEVSR